MLLHQVGRDKWTVLAIARSESHCDLQGILAQQGSNQLGERMLALLRLHIPSNGPPHNEEISKQLNGDIYEFRRTPNRGPALRVLWFYDEGKVIVCTHGFWKKTQKTPSAEIQKAQQLRKDYLRAKRSSSIRVVPATW